MQIRWTEWFSTRAERRRYIKVLRRKTKAEGKKLHILKRSYCKQRCTGKIMYYADLLLD